jgi:hypothetical protein
VSYDKCFMVSTFDVVLLIIFVTVAIAGVEVVMGGCSVSVDPVASINSIAMGAPLPSAAIMFMDLDGVWERVVEPGWTLLGRWWRLDGLQIFIEGIGDSSSGLGIVINVGFEGHDVALVVVSISLLMLLRI